MNVQARDRETYSKKRAEGTKREMAIFKIDAILSECHILIADIQ